MVQKVWAEFKNEPEQKLEFQCPRILGSETNTRMYSDTLAQKWGLGPQEIEKQPEKGTGKPVCENHCNGLAMQNVLPAGTLLGS